MPIGTKDLLLTFDYELFQGTRSGTVANCMLIPTDNILSILSKHKATAIFFVDMLHIVRLKEVAEKYPNAKRDYDLIEKQIIKMAEQGHYIFNHLHPHWLDAKYDAEINEWRLLDTSKYIFASITAGERDKVFAATMDLLNDILQKASKKQAPTGFRAGGLYIQPFSAFKKYFDQYNICCDFSVLAGAKGDVAESGNAAFDFSKVEKFTYTFNDDITVADDKGNYREYALKIAYIPFEIRLRNRIFFWMNAGDKTLIRFGDGIATNKKIRFPKIGKLSSTETYAVEVLNSVKVPFYISELDRNNILHLLSHPKLVSPHNLEMLDRFLGKVIAKSAVEFDFKRFSLPA